MRNRSFLVVMIVVVAMGAVAIGLAQTVFAENSPPPPAATRSQVPGDAIANLPAHLQAAATRFGLELTTSRNVAPNVYLVSKSDGQLCMIGTVHGMTAGCAPADDFFGTNAVQYGISEDGRPEAPSAMTIFGVARPDIVAVRVVFPSGPVEVPLSTDGGFSLTASTAQLQQGRPTQLVALNAESVVVQTFALPQS